MKILVWDLNAKLGREDILKPTTGNESLHETSNGHGVRIVNFATTTNLTNSVSEHPVAYIKSYNKNPSLCNKYILY
jgi:hypothetical protein